MSGTSTGHENDRGTSTGHQNDREAHTGQGVDGGTSTGHGSDRSAHPGHGSDPGTYTGHGDDHEALAGHQTDCEAPVGHGDDRGTSAGCGDDREAPTGHGSDRDAPTGHHNDRGTRVTVLVALGANLLIAVAKAVGGLLAHSPALLSEAAHSVADSVNEIFLLAALRRSRRPADARHPFGYGKERYFWSLLAAVGIFVMGGCFSVYQGIEALRSGAREELGGYVAGLVVLGVAFLAEGASLLRALHQMRSQGGKDGGLRDPALRTVVAEDGTAVLGVTLALAGMALHMVTGQVVWEASASLAIGVLLVYVAYRLGRDARDQLIGEAVDPESSDRIRALLDAQPEIDSVEALFTMRTGLESALVAARVDLVPGMESEHVEEVAVRIKRSIGQTFPEGDQIFLDITDRNARETREDPAATGERGGA
ncbi:cation diffusion facilitator family transporter [Streptomyces sp. NPDC090106]|uniref:cation diffusion facilitator family transporter n=1 Tax=Streptomyces sp. NPDC090106 TaxID=3365946 RepID=UPI00382AEAC1